MERARPRIADLVSKLNSMALERAEGPAEAGVGPGLAHDRRGSSTFAPQRRHTMSHDHRADGEAQRLDEDARRLKNWKRWGPYLSERQWATVREDYSPDGNLWESFPYEHSLARAYRWGEAGLLGLTDRECRLCLALALWTRKDPPPPAG